MTSETDIRHGLEPVAPFLPGNSRRIKRIVNMVSAFQESGQVAAQIDPLSFEWRLLVLWIVIMSEFLMAWRDLVLDEELANEVVEHVGNADVDGRVTMLPLSSDASAEEKARREKVIEVVSDSAIVRLLRGDAFNEADGGERSHSIGQEALAWLRRRTPLG